MQSALLSFSGGLKCDEAVLALIYEVYKKVGIFRLQQAASKQDCEIWKLTCATGAAELLQFILFCCFFSKLN